MTEAAISDLRQSEPRGIGGWLIFPMLGAILSLFINLKSVGDDLALISSPGFQKYQSAFQAFAIMETVVVFCVICAWAYVLYLLFKKKAQFPVVFNAVMLFSLVFSIGEGAAMYSAWNVPMDAASIRDIGKTFVSCVVWVPYMLRSKRVRNTFVN